MQTIPFGRGKPAVENGSGAKVRLRKPLVSPYPEKTGPCSPTPSASFRTFS
jgi:hypothetical protein